MSKAASLISSATSNEDMLAVGLLSLPVMAAHQEMIQRMRAVVESKEDSAEDEIHSRFGGFSPNKTRS